MTTEKFVSTAYHIGRINAYTQAILEELRDPKPNHENVTRWTRRIDDQCELIFNNIPYEVK